jgi:hypothetical protein
VIVFLPPPTLYSYYHGGNPPASRPTQHPCRRTTPAVIAQNPISPETKRSSRSPETLAIISSINYPEPIQQGAQRHPEHQHATSRQGSQLQERGLWVAPVARCMCLWFTKYSVVQKSVYEPVTDCDEIKRGKNVFSYTIHAHTDPLPSCSPLPFPSSIPLFQWRSWSSEL